MPVLHQESRLFYSTPEYFDLTRIFSKSNEQYTKKEDIDFMQSLYSSPKNFVSTTEKEKTIATIRNNKNAFITTDNRKIIHSYNESVSIVNSWTLFWAIYRSVYPLLPESEYKPLIEYAEKQRLSEYIKDHGYKYIKQNTNHTITLCAIQETVAEIIGQNINNNTLPQCVIYSVFYETTIVMWYPEKKLYCRFAFGDKKEIHIEYNPKKYYAPYVIINDKTHQPDNSWYEITQYAKPISGISSFTSSELVELYNRLFTEQEEDERFVHLPKKQKIYEQCKLRVVWL